MFKLIFSVAAVTALAQLLQLASQPLLTYLYTKESFGYLSVVMSIVAFAALICNFQFNNLILISKENTNKLFRSGLFFSALFELIVFLILFLFSFYIFSENRFTLYLLTIFYLSFYCFNVLFRAAMLKEGRNKVYSFGILIRSLVVVLGQVFFSFFYETFGLIIGMVVGEFILILYGLYYGSGLISFKGSEFKEILAPLVSERKFLIIGTIQELTSTSMFLAPLLLIIYKYSYELGGEFSVVHKLAWGPAFLLAQVVSPILLQHLSKENFKENFLFDIKKAIIFFVISSVTIYFSAEFFFSLILKSDWYNAIWMSKYIIIWALSFIMALPYRVLIRSEKRQEIQFLTDLCILSIFLSIFFIDYDFQQYILLLTLFGVFGNFIVMLLGGNLARRRGWV